MPGRINDEDVAAVRERSPIAEVIGEHVQLRNAGGGNLKGLCPFHDEKSPSLSVSVARNLFHCFGCGAGGDVIRFVERIEHLSFTEAVERLAGRAGIQLRYSEGSRPGPTVRPAGPAGRGARAGGRVLRRAAAQRRRRAGPALPGRARLRCRGGAALRLRLRAGRLGCADQLPARPRFPAGGADAGRAVPGVRPGQPDRPVPPPAAVADQGRRPATWWASARAGSTTTTGSRPST